MGIAAEDWWMFLIFTVDEVEILGQSGSPVVEILLVVFQVCTS